MFLTVRRYESIARVVHGVGVGHIVIGSDGLAGGVAVGVVVEVWHHLRLDSTGTQERKLRKTLIWWVKKLVTR